METQSLSAKVCDYRDTLLYGSCSFSYGEYRHSHQLMRFVDLQFPPWEQESFFPTYSRMDSRGTMSKLEFEVLMLYMCSVKKQKKSVSILWNSECISCMSTANCCCCCSCELWVYLGFLISRISKWTLCTGTAPSSRKLRLILCTIVDRLKVFHPKSFLMVSMRNFTVYFQTIM